MASDSTSQKLSRAFEDIALRDFGSPEALLQTIKDLIRDDVIDINDFNGSNPMSETILSMKERRRAINLCAASLVLFDVIQLFGVIPFNMINIIVIFNKRELWTQTNALMCINSAFQLVQSFITIPGNWCAMFEEICFLPLSINTGYLIGWVTWTFTMRISNNTYFALCMMRFSAICLPLRMRPDFLRREVSPAVILFWSLALSLPAAVFTLVLLMAAPATGIPWSHGLQLKHGKYQLHSWQIIPDWKYHFRNQEGDQPFVVSIVVGILALVQVLSTFLMFIAIISKSIMSTTSVERLRTGNRVDLQTSKKGSTKMVCHIYNGSKENIEFPDPPPKLTMKPEVPNKISLQEEQGNIAKVQPINKERNVSISVPMTEVTLAVSKMDIMTTASLSAQLLVMFLTLSLTVSAVKNNGQTVSFEEWFKGWMYLLFAHTMNTLVDPFVCVICSSVYRNALYELLSGSKNTVKTTRRPLN